MKAFKMVFLIALLAFVVVGVYAWYLIGSMQDELNKKRTEAARAARWKEKENLNTDKNEQESETNTN